MCFFVKTGHLNNGCLTLQAAQFDICSTLHLAFDFCWLDKAVEPKTSEIVLVLKRSCFATLPLSQSLESSSLVSEKLPGSSSLTRCAPVSRLQFSSCSCSSSSFCFCLANRNAASFYLLTCSRLCSSKSKSCCLWPEFMTFCNLNFCSTWSSLLQFSLTHPFWEIH